MMEFKGIRKEYEVIENKILDSLKRVMRNGNFILGKEVSELEERLAEYVGVKHCVTCANGTDGLILALMAIGIKAGDFVLVPAFSYVATASCVSLLGATPVFVDVDKSTYNISPESLKDAIIECKKKDIHCKAIITVDLFGLPADYEKIELIAQSENLIIIEDGAQGFGGNINGNRACSFGNISVTSFFPAKPFGAYGDGGAIFTDDDEYAERIWSLRSHGRSPKDKYDNSILGFNSRLDTLQAVILLEKFDLFTEQELKKTDEIALKYSRELSDLVKVPTVPEGMFSSWAQYTIALKNKQERDRLKDALAQQKIPTMIYYNKPLHKQKALENALSVVCLDNSNMVADIVLSLPIHPFMSDEEVLYVIKTIRGFFETDF